MAVLQAVPLLLALPDVVQDLEATGSIGLGDDTPAFLLDHGVALGDRIINLNAVPLTDTNAILGTLRKLEEGEEDTARLGLERDGKDLFVIYRIVQDRVLQPGSEAEPGHTE